MDKSSRLFKSHICVFSSFIAGAGLTDSLSSYDTFPFYQTAAVINILAYHNTLIQQKTSLPLWLTWGN